MKLARVQSFLGRLYRPRREMVYFYLVAYVPLISLVLAWGGSTCTTVPQGFFSRSLPCVLAQPLAFIFLLLVSLVLAYLYAGPMAYFFRNPINRWCEEYRVAEVIFRPSKLALFFTVYVTAAYTFYATVMFVLVQSDGVNLLLFGLMFFFLPVSLVYLTVLASYGLWVDLTGVELQINALPVSVQAVLAVMVIVASLLIGVTWFPLLARGFEKATLWIYGKLRDTAGYLRDNEKVRNGLLGVFAVLLVVVLLAGVGVAYVNVDVPFGKHVEPMNTTSVPSLPARADVSNQTVASYMEVYHETKLRNRIIKGNHGWLEKMYGAGYNLESVKVNCNPTVTSRTGFGNNTSVSVKQNCSWGFTLVDDWGSRKKNYSFNGSGVYIVERRCRTYITMDDLRRGRECNWVTEKESGAS